MGRQPQQTIVIGQQGGGKTHTTLKLIAKYVAKYNRPVLIVDKNGEYGHYIDVNGKRKVIKAIYYDATIGISKIRDIKNSTKRAMGKPNSSKTGLIGINKVQIAKVIRISKDLQRI